MLAYLELQLKNPVFKLQSQSGSHKDLQFSCIKKLLKLLASQFWLLIVIHIFMVLGWAHRAKCTKLCGQKIVTPHSNLVEIRPGQRQRISYEFPHSDSQWNYSGALNTWKRFHSSSGQLWPTVFIYFISLLPLPRKNTSTVDLTCSNTNNCKLISSNLIQTQA